MICAGYKVRIIIGKHLNFTNLSQTAGMSFRLEKSTVAFFSRAKYYRELKPDSQILFRLCPKRLELMRSNTVKTGY